MLRLHPSAIAKRSAPTANPFRNGASLSLRLKSSFGAHAQRGLICCPDPHKTDGAFTALERGRARPRRGTPGREGWTIAGATGTNARAKRTSPATAKSKHPPFPKSGKNGAPKMHGSVNQKIEAETR